MDIDAFVYNFVMPFKIQTPDSRLAVVSGSVPKSVQGVKLFYANLSPKELDSAALSCRMVQSLCTVFCRVRFSPTKSVPMSFKRGGEYLALPRAAQSWLIDDILPTSGLLNIYGPPKAGKTYAAVDLACALADPTRDTFMNWGVRRHGPVWYLQIDTPRALFQDGYIQRAVDIGWNVNDLYIADLQMVPYPYNILGDGKPFLRKAFVEAIHAYDLAPELSPPPPIALIVDTLRDAHGGDENDSGIMRNVVTSFVDAIKPDEGDPPAIIFLSHQKKLQADQPLDLMSSNRGSNYLAGRMDAVMCVREGEIRAQSRAIVEVVLSNYKRSPQGFWVCFNENAEIAKMLAIPFPSAHARHEAFAAAWTLSVSTAQNYFKNFTERGGFDKYPERKKAS